MEGEVVVQMPIHAQRPQAQNRLSPLQAPTGTGDFHPLFDQVAASTLYDTRGDRPTISERLRVVQPLAILQQILSALIERRTLGLR